MGLVWQVSSSDIGLSRGVVGAFYAVGVKVGIIHAGVTVVGICDGIGTVVGIFHAAVAVVRISRGVGNVVGIHQATVGVVGMPHAVGIDVNSGMTLGLAVVDFTALWRPVVGEALQSFCRSVNRAGSGAAKYLHGSV